ncbi:cytochrome P450 [Nocardia heshunensis]
MPIRDFGWLRAARKQFGGEVLEKMFDRYGDTFMMTVPPGLDPMAGLRRIVFFRDPSVVKQLFTASEEDIDLETGNTFLEFIQGDRALVTLSGQEHRRVRKPLVPRMRGGELTIWAEDIEARSRQLAQSWIGAGTFHLKTPFTDLTLETILQMVVAPEPGVRDVWKHTVHNLLETCTSDGFMLRYFLRRVGGLATWRSAHKVRRISDSLIYNEISRRRSEGMVERMDLLDLLMRVDGATDQDIRDQLISLVIAGHDTTANLLTWTVDFMLRNPEVMAKVVTEARTPGGGDTYLEAVINESLRMHAVVPFVLRVTRKPYQLGEFVIPANTLIVPIITSIHHRPELYPEPEKFKPERFLGAKPGTYEFIPFGGGPHRCLGDRLAFFQAKIALQTILREVDLHYESGRPDTSGVTLNIFNDIHVSATRR